MKSVCALLASSLLLASCGGSTTPATEPAASGGLETRPYANLAQMMRAIPFTASNIIFDAQTQDPAAPPTEAPGGASAGATKAYANVYGGWQQVENAALALQETANLLLIPGRKCMNGKDAPLDQADYRQAIQQLADAGAAALKAAQAKDMDQIVDASGVVSEACAACHEPYRDTENEADRCTPKTAAK